MENGRITALVVAGGRGERYGGTVKKQFLPLRGIPLLIRSLLLFRDRDWCDALYAGIPEEDWGYAVSLFREWGLESEVRLTPAGETRQETVCRALESMPETDFIIIHDAVRPLAGASLLERGLKALEAHEAVIPVIPVTDTVKEVENGYVMRTLERDRLRRAQTPQFFHLPSLKALHREYRGRSVTDDSLLFELKNFAVFTILGEEDNIKITTPADLMWAEKLCEAKGL
ncbi:MAG TPA: IspD/TarI family cytidylyltransferase [Candidatus Mcinerneyibacteriales bacterium]|nr:IspD/TarI family cytidylyltransferase [Candidatus Mcinerneyibacteriales bacterium]HPE20434.1 IspD/TarI family cytidylyltransferase [Candidatus Mcinerneyibacteriales bacterium]HPJ69413.1 IspD/TarI family cytidylyltransferase [Candidatus Mcinerneyibacteriales bacterium]HPQ89930.1 IspD/TarI family cytidylyltransferase [Candidatus Mcinerneyibacteriales bacterium]